VRRWIRSGKLRSEKLGNQHLVELDAVDALVGAPPADEDERVEVAGAWGEWLRGVEAFQQRLGARGARIPPAAELIRAGRGGR
jgi:hypothetical protein